MITSVVLGTFGLLAGLLGIQCSKVGGDNLVLKGRIAGTGGVFFLLQGNTKDTKFLLFTLKEPSYINYLLVLCNYLELFPPP